MKKMNADLLISEKRQFYVLDRALRYARSKLGPDITVQRLLILINVYTHEGLSQNELLEKLESTSIPALSRNLADMSKRTSRRTEGPDLVELRTDTQNLRKKRIYLTRRGRQILNRLIKILASPVPAD